VTGHVANTRFSFDWRTQLALVPNENATASKQTATPDSVDPGLHAMASEDHVPEVAGRPANWNP